MFAVTEPAAMNEVFARAFNSRSIDNLLALYESDAILKTDAGDDFATGLAAIGDALSQLLLAPGTMRSANAFCLVHGDIALLRADWSLSDGDRLIAAGSSAEIVRRQPDGRWLYVIDHATGASVESPAAPGATKY